MIQTINRQIEGLMTHGTGAVTVRSARTSQKTHHFYQNKIGEEENEVKTKNLREVVHRVKFF
jgi:hypothetical protein